MRSIPIPQKADIHTSVSTFNGKISTDWDGFDQHDTVTLLLKPNRYYVTFDSNRPKDPMSCYFPSTPEWGRYIHYNAPYGTKADGDNDADAPLPIPTLRGYRFLGWYTEPEGGEQVTDTTRMKKAGSTRRPIASFRNGTGRSPRSRFA